MMRFVCCRKFAQSWLRSLHLECPRTTADCNVCVFVCGVWGWVWVSLRQNLTTNPLFQSAKNVNQNPDQTTAPHGETPRTTGLNTYLPYYSTKHLPPHLLTAKHLLRLRLPLYECFKVIWVYTAHTNHRERETHICREREKGTQRESVRVN